ncbi:GntR family transcriptional regulator [Paraburkholderia sp. LEh10]|jgi:hypothetical protein|uniref:GntR family transcriptional regulator n=1 Tax=Paraburkholderia sp. LEh10 TaxID=2821353 RepID=UPI001AE1B9BA|nr:GntR family transcriptional regulator [Paraburkholderia sp. LEh10]MBP0588188.1 GntR family transcriptional regulator [Paraburkholderia sp. LEh10]
MSDEHLIAPLDGRLIDLMADGKEWTTKLLAEALGTSRNSVGRALSTLAAEGKLRIVQVKSAGCGPRPFKHEQA